MLRVAVIGSGRIAQGRHIPEFASHPHVKLAGLYNHTYETAATLAEQYHCQAYASVEDIFADPSIDAVSVCSANFLHAEHTIRALKAGKHVLCEKPMAMTIEECEQMVAAAQTSGKNLMLAMNQRFDAAHAKAKELISKGVIGKVLTFHTTLGHGGPERWSGFEGRDCWFFDKGAAGIGVLADLGIHKTDLIQYLIGEKILRVSASISTLDKKDRHGNIIGIDDNAVCIFETSGNIMGTMTASWTYYGQGDNSTVIYGSEGSLHIYEDPNRPLYLVHKDGSTETITLPKDVRSGVIDEFIASIEEKRKPLCSADEALHSMKAIFASIDSSRLRKAIEIL